MNRVDGSSLLLQAPLRDAQIAAARRAKRMGCGKPIRNCRHNGIARSH